MADTKISDLTAAPYLVGSELFPIVDAGLANESVTFDQINAGSLLYLNADYTLTSTTASQKLFNAPTNGRLTFTETGLYMWEAQLWITTMSATSGNARIDILGAGTATLAGQIMRGVGSDNNTPANAGTVTGSGALGSNSSPASALTAGTGTAMAIWLRGMFKVTATGTLIPSLSLVTANAAVMKAGSWFKVGKVAPGSVYSVGNWD